MKPVTLVLVGVCTFVLGTAANAQRNDPAVDRSAAAKARGEAMAGQQAQTYEQHAQDRAQMLYYYYYNQPKPTITTPQAKELVAGVRKDLSESDKALLRLKAEHAKEPAVVKQIASIQAHHKRVHEVCGMAEKECLKNHPDHGTMADCCGQMWHEIEAAKADTAKLLKMLNIKSLEPPKKPESQN